MLSVIIFIVGSTDLDRPNMLSVRSIYYRKLCATTGVFVIVIRNESLLEIRVRFQLNSSLFIFKLVRYRVA